MAIPLKKSLPDLTDQADDGLKKTVFVAMSGGVDSSVAAALLKKANFNVVGVYMKPYQPANLPINCLWEEDREDAARVAAKLNIPFLTWDFSKEYEKEVVDYMIKGYKSGITPNPDVMCNKYIKFGLFLEKAKKNGADFIATGHYARLKPEITNSKIQITNKIQIPKSETGIKLLKAKDQNKDQTYFLWTLTQDQLKYCLFPVGDYTKPEVRKLARKFGLHNSDKKDSQGICFIGPLNVKDFLKAHIKTKKGKIILGNKVISQHDGVFYYTIGEKIAVESKPYFIIDKNIKENILYVSENRSQKSKKEFKIIDVNLIQTNLKFPLSCLIKTRYQQKEIKAVLKMKNRNQGVVKLIKPLPDITPGQSAVFYKGSQVIGGGIIQ